MIAVVDYGVGNLFSLQASLAAVGLSAKVTAHADEIASADRVILPGVGAFGDAIAKLRATGLFSTLQRVAGAGKPLLGICLGMQLLFEESVEFGTHEGLSLLPGRIVPLKGAIAPTLKVPHMGWNTLDIHSANEPLLAHTRHNDRVYFVHSFYADAPGSVVAATAPYGVAVPAIVRQGNVCGCQFHPEKSGKVGLAMLSDWGASL